MLTLELQLSGTEHARAKEDTAAIMRAKQAAGTSIPQECPWPSFLPTWPYLQGIKLMHSADMLTRGIANAKKAGESSGGGK